MTAPMTASHRPFICASYGAPKSTKGHAMKADPRPPRCTLRRRSPPAEPSPRPRPGRAGADAAGVDFSATSTTRGSRSGPVRRYVYTGVKDGKRSRDVVTVTHRDEDDRRRPLRRRRRPALPARPARRAHDRLVQPGLAAATSGTSARTPPSSTRAATSRAPRAPGRPASTAPRPGIYMPAHPRVGQIRPAGVLQGPRRGPLQGDRPLQHRQRARHEERAAHPGDGRRSSRARSTTSCTCAASAPCSSRPSRGPTSATSSSPSRGPGDTRR